jgi:tetratricopeptide (TPR) repeat protein
MPRDRGPNDKKGTTAKAAEAKGNGTGPAGAAASSGAASAGVPLAVLQHRAMDLYQAGQLGPALQACRDILALAPARVDALAFAGMVAFEAGASVDSVAFNRRAIALKPDFAEAHYNLANALKSLHRLEEAASAYRSALLLRPGLMPAHHNLGSTLLELGRAEEAAASFRRALACEATSAGERDLGLACEKLGLLDEAIAAYRRALALPNARADLHSNLANALLSRGDPMGAFEACERWLALVPASVEAAALTALAARELGQEEPARFLLDFDRFVQVIDCDAPPGYASMAAFNAALVEAIEADPSLKVPDKDHPTYHNDVLEKTGELLLATPKGALAALETMMRDAVQLYLSSVPRDPPHPFFEYFPATWLFSCWATRLKGEGFLSPHVHFDGYLGGVYYPLLPDVVAQSGQGEAGWFELGRPPARLNCKAAPVVRRIQPREGRMILFPGYFFHDTVPFTSTQRRISIAFDVVPRA